jgi:hypothetical protein
MQETSMLKSKREKQVQKKEENNGSTYDDKKQENWYKTIEIVCKGEIKDGRNNKNEGKDNMVKWI